MYKFRISLVPSLLLFLFLFQQGSCDSTPPATGGIRVAAYERLALIATTFPVPGQSHTGVEILHFGGGAGTQTSIAGVTGPNGRSDYPNARTNSSWTVSLVSTIGCIFGPNTGNVPPQGGVEFYFTCIFY